ncbi:uncharacterized protein LOC126573985 [Anopheles aquasalis]|uniref:uncharacterized protein LOC126573985 n=1 Tax=Anopheles aquasalis TaxID=42839 RepID=UPI00215AF88C|nr:uncharacterized protein LOC126573985 [Anopheles aquasalis]XP_050089811.1 uncharacterized protein LOC126573985 [Anopheles aquasalis]XP_050089812.1 uncharacterized protein LOC126573985 [Anopheles aquasalis]XP_050089813.1 uncharacterized protein LOC126573985 [Anopheles aquasalis]XP_050089814.1 uncharacterized protein LOC126573985 [Anopheles aquasalis]
MPAYAGFDSFASSRRTAESIYYSAKEYDSAEEPEYVRRASILEDAPTTIFNRRYVDPWDMENYVYIRKQVLEPTSESEVPPSPAGEPIQSKFYYVPGELNELDCQECSSVEQDEYDPDFSEAAMVLEHERRLAEEVQAVDGLPGDMLEPVDKDDRILGVGEPGSGLEEGEEEEEDEEGFYTERYDTVMDEDSIAGDEHVYSSYTDLENSETEQPSSCDSSMSALRLHTPGFGKSASSRRPIVLPKPLPQLEFPGPPSYEYYEPSCCYMPLPPPPPPPPPPSHHMAGPGHYHHHHQHTHTHTHTHPPMMGPPSLTGTILSDHHNYYTLNDCLECARQEAEHVPLYATTSTTGSPTRRRSRSVSVVSQSMSLARRPSQMLDPATAIAIAATNANVCYTPQHFSLSKKGLLQIDYSCNWNNLDRYITK